ncbi:hypothetical protein ACWGKW_43905 [Streptomyces sp. NPDC054766]
MSRTSEALPSSPYSPPPRFGMAEAVVIVAFLAAAVLLILLSPMTIPQILSLLGGVGTVAGGVLLTGNMKNARAGGVAQLKSKARQWAGPGDDGEGR